MKNKEHNFLNNLSTQSHRWPLSSHKAQMPNAPSIPLYIYIKQIYKLLCTDKANPHLLCSVAKLYGIRQEWFRGTHRLHLHGRSEDAGSTFLWNVHTFLPDNKIFGMAATVIFTVISHRDYTVYYTPNDHKLTYSPTLMDVTYAHVCDPKWFW